MISFHHKHILGRIWIKDKLSRWFLINSNPCPLIREISAISSTGLSPSVAVLSRAFNYRLT
jgi:hypothetical protein